MKKIIIVTILFALLLTACGSRSGNNNQNAPLSESLKLLLGTLKLDGTPNAVTSKEASDLIVLWQTYKTLTTGSSTSQAETDALIKQIQSTMTPEQIKAIDAMQLTRKDMGEILQAQGITFSRDGQPGAGNGTPFPGGGGGGFNGGGGGFFNGGGGGGGGQNLTPQQIATAQARRAAGG